MLHRQIVSFTLKVEKNGLNMKMFFILTITFSFGIMVNGFSAKVGRTSPPFFPPEYNITEIEVNSGDSVTLPCPSADYRFWTQPFLAEYYQRCDYDVERHQEDIVDNGESLFIPKATYANTGLYVCTRNNSEYFAYYLYVKDINILSLTNTRPFFGDVTVPQGFEAKIPCTPTSKDVNVDLYIGDSADPEKSTKVEINSENKVAYNPQTGFSINETSTPGVRIYICKFTRDKMEEVVTGRLIVTSNDYSLPFGSMSQLYNKYGRLIVQCAYNDDGSGGFSIEWITPQKSSDKRIHKFSFKETERFFNQTVNWFTINSADTRDDGFYYCKISKNNTVFSINQLFIKIRKLGFLSGEL